MHWREYPIINHVDHKCGEISSSCKITITISGSSITSTESSCLSIIKMISIYLFAILSYSWDYHFVFWDLLIVVWYIRDKVLHLQILNDTAEEPIPWRIPYHNCHCTFIPTCKLTTIPAYSQGNKQHRIIWIRKYLRNKMCKRACGPLEDINSSWNIVASLHPVSIP